MAAPHFIVHDAEDTVGVVVVEGVTAGMKLDGWVMQDDSRIELEAKADIPLGHKVALDDIEEGDTIIKYGHDIGRATAGMTKGDHAHVQNVKTKRW